MFCRLGLPCSRRDKRSCKTEKINVYPTNRLEDGCAIPNKHKGRQDDVPALCASVVPVSFPLLPLPLSPNPVALVSFLAVGDLCLRSLIPFMMSRYEPHLEGTTLAGPKPAEISRRRPTNAPRLLYLPTLSSMPFLRPRTTMPMSLQMRHQLSRRTKSFSGRCFSKNARKSSKAGKIVHMAHAPAPPLFIVVAVVAT
jgi:hypothetical protein